MAPKVLIILTSQAFIPANNHPSGWYLVIMSFVPAMIWLMEALTNLLTAGIRPPILCSEWQGRPTCGVP